MKKIKIAMVLILTVQLFVPFFPSGKSTHEVLAESAVGEDVILPEVSQMTDAEIVEALKSVEEENPELVSLRTELAETYPQNQIAAEVDIQDMTQEQESIFLELVDIIVSEVDLPTVEDTKDYIEAIVGMFDSNSKNYQDIEATNEIIFEEIDENHSSIFDSLSAEEVLAAKRGWLSVWVLGTATNIAINIAVVSVGGSIWYAVKKYGVKWVRDRFYSRVKARLVAVGLGMVGGYYGILWEFLFACWDPGMAFAKYIDARDKIRRNGFIEL